MHIYLLGSRINCFSNYEQAYERLHAYIMNINSSCYITVNNAHTLVEAVMDRKYRTIINKSLYSLADGGSLSIVGQYKGVKEMKRIFGPSFMELCFQRGQFDSLKHFLFGGTQETINEMYQVIRDRYPRAIIVGTIAPPFRSFTNEENRTFIKKIRDSKADIIWVSLGAPKQERWIYEVYKELDRGIFIGIGAGFSYLTGRIKHAPQWMKRYALEWVYRLIQEPRRLYKRYLVANTLFILFLFLETIGLLRFSKDPRS